MNEYRGYKNLNVWNKSMSLCEKIYVITKRFPQEEQFGLTSQVRRSSLSLPSNIAEGATRGSKKEFIQFLYIAFGSGAEVETQVLLAHRLGYIDEQIYQNISNEITDVMKMLNKLITSLKPTKNE